MSSMMTVLGQISISLRITMRYMMIFPERTKKRLTLLASLCVYYLNNRSGLFYDSKVDYIYPAEQPVDDRPSDGMPVTVRYDHCQSGTERDPTFQIITFLHLYKPPCMYVIY